MKGSLSRYIPVADAVAGIFKPHVEVVIHDIQKDVVFYIANPFSNRKAGDRSLLGFNDINSNGFPMTQDVEGPYENAGVQGQRIRSISSVLKDDQGGPIGMMCINVDFSLMESSLDVLENFLRPVDTDAPPEILFKNDWRDNIKLEIRKFLLEKNITFDNINAAYRKALIRKLEEKRLFYARKSVEEVARLLGISRATAYKDLRTIRKQISKSGQSHTESESR